MEVTKQVFESKLKLNMGMTGKHGWEITIYGDDLDKIIEELDSTDKKLQEKFQHDNGGVED
jgi:hypothetical protein